MADGFGSPGLPIREGGLPLFTISATASCNFYAVNGAISADIPHPLTISATASVGLPDIHGTIEDALPALTMSGTAARVGFISATLPALTIEMKTGGQIEADLPSLTISSTGNTHRIGRIEADIPALTISAIAGGGIDGELPLITASISGVTGKSGTIVARLPLLTIVATGSTPTVGAISGTLPRLQMTGAGSQPSTAAISGTLPAPTLEISALVGALAQISGTLPLFELDATGYIEAHGNLTGTLPSLTMLGQIIANTVITYSDADTSTVTGYAICLNADHGAVTEYLNYAFNSFAYFNGKFIGAKSTGLYELTGTTDSGTIIEATVRTSTSDFGSSLKKRAPNAYIGLSSAGTIEMRVITDRGEENDAISLLADTDDMATQKIKIGRGIKSRYWALELTNPDGHDFNLDSMELEPEVSRRKL